MDRAVIGLAFGDEGKGSFIDFLASESEETLLVKYSGGAQASHTVILSDGLPFRFSQLSAGMTGEGNSTYLSDNFAVNPFSLVEECRAFAERQGQSAAEILRRVIVDLNAPTVTRFHRALNRVEMAKTAAFRGSVGTGASTVGFLLRDRGLVMRMGDLLSPRRAEILKSLQAVLAEECSGFVFSDAALNAQLSAMLSADAVSVLEAEYGRLFDDNFFNTAAALPEKRPPILAEGSQGLLLDRRLGTAPHTTGLNTSADWLRQNLPDAALYGAVRAVWTRHGPGIFPTADSALDARLTDANQERGKYNGSIRFGWFDAVLLNYSLSHARPRALALSCADMLDAPARICVGYRYSGALSPAFESRFAFEREKDGAVIRKVLSLDEAACALIARCTPVYTELTGGDIEEKFIGAVERLCTLPVELVSRGPARQQKRWR